MKKRKRKRKKGKKKRKKRKRKKGPVRKTEKCVRGQNSPVRQVNEAEMSRTT